MWNGQVIELRDWNEFADRLTNELDSLGHRSCFAVRNFSLQTYDLDEDDNIIGFVDRLALVRKNGTDRDDHSAMWDAPGHDYDHKGNESGMSPSAIIYAYVAEAKGDGYLVHYQGEPETLDLTIGLTENDGILIYDATQLERVAKNECWFLTSPQTALLLVFKLLPGD